MIIKNKYNNRYLYYNKDNYLCLRNIFQNKDDNYKKKIEFLY